MVVLLWFEHSGEQVPEAEPVPVLVLVLLSKLMSASSEKVVQALVEGLPSCLHDQERRIDLDVGVCPLMVHAETHRILRNDGWVVDERRLALRHPLVSPQLTVDPLMAGVDPAWPLVAAVDVVELRLAVAICPLGKEAFVARHAKVAVPEGAAGIVACDIRILLECR